MYSFLFSAALENLLFLALHITGSGSFPRALSPKEERDCLVGIRAGDPAARSRLIEHNLRLVAHIAKKYYAAGGEQDDLISIGTIGLIKAVSTFDSEKGSRFSTYASRCIENAILSQRNKLDLDAKTSHHVAKNGAYSVTYADTGMS